MKLFIGLMSGTSMDGIDAALVDLTTNTFIDGLTRPYSASTRQAMNKVLTGEHNLGTYSQLNTLLGREFAQAVIELLAKAKVSASTVKAIGSHGQTLCHDTSAEIPYTVQLGCAHTIAEITGIPVVADFRTRDLVLGGQGAPFAPIYHQALFANMDSPLAIVNIGGIANITFLTANDKVSGFDIGPGNCLMDAWILKHQGKNYDKDGTWAASGCLIDELMSSLLDDPFFNRQQPKSIGKEYFSLNWLEQRLLPHYSEADVQACLLRLTATLIAETVIKQQNLPWELLICGGGAHNKALMQTLSQLLPDIKVLSTEAFNINPDFIEAQMFAWLAEKTLSNTPLNLNHITGAKHEAVLGAIYPAGIDKGISLEV